MKRSKSAIKVVFFIIFAEPTYFESIIQKWHDLLPNWAIIAMLAVIITVNIISSYFGFSLLSKITALAVIPVLLLNYFFS